MIHRSTKLRLRRDIKRHKRQIGGLSVQAEEQFEQHFFGRLNRLVLIRRFVLGWLLLFVLLIGGVAYQMTQLSQYYQKVVPIAGGTYIEGVLGNFTNASPLYAVSSVDSSVSKLLFSGLFKFDQSNHLVPDLAQSMKVDTAGTTYTITLKPDLKWQDGTQLTAQDVVFTYQTIQNPDAKSPFLANWQGVKVAAVDARHLTFTTPNVLAAFPNSLINGIVPKHLLSNVPPTQLRSVRFNTTDMVGSGPFKLDRIEVSGDTPETRNEQLAFLPNKYFYNGPAKLQHMQIRSFHDEKSMIQSFKKQEINAMSGLSELPDTVAKDATVHDNNIPLTGEVAVFFRNSQDILKDPNVRAALVRSVNQASLVKNLPFPALPAREPILQGQVGYDPTLTQQAYDKAAAAKQLDDAGWKVGAGGVRFKDGKPLTFQLYAQNNSEFTYVTQTLQKSWAQIGVKVDVILQSTGELGDTVSTHHYDALLYGISIGADPDVFAYWHSSQSDIRSANRLNFSEYKSADADKALEGGRTRSDPALRAAKYKPFLQAWRTDAPALVLYQPHYLYVVRGNLYNFQPKVVNDATDRFDNVQNWMVRVTKDDE